jgi:hypothetical protein
MKDIFATPGTKVKYTGENGTWTDHNLIQSAGFSVGDILTVNFIEVSEWYSCVHFLESEFGFNSVCFEELD